MRRIYGFNATITLGIERQTQSMDKKGSRRYMSFISSPAIQKQNARCSRTNSMFASNVIINDGMFSFDQFHAGMKQDE